MDPIKTLNQRNASRADLRQALACALGLPCPEWGNQSVGVYAECRRFFLSVYEQTVGMEYCWQAKDGGCLSNIIKKLYGVAKNTDDSLIIHSFKYMIEHLPAWYIERGLSLCIVNSKFNEIIAEIKNNEASKKRGVSDSYKQKVLRDLFA